MSSIQAIPRQVWSGEKKIKGTDYYEEKHLKTLEAWERFIKGHRDIDTSIVPRYIVDSWIRCERIGVDPLGRMANDILIGGDLADLLKTNHDFINTSLPFMKNLYRFLEGSGFFVCLFDRQGFLLEIIGDHDAEELVRKANGVVGALWSERCAGNNAAGTVVAMKKPVQIFACQHYKRICHTETGSGAPIFGPGGEFLGGIALSGRYYRTNPHTLGMTVAAAHAIGNELKTRKALIESQIANCYQKTVIASIPEALITIDNGGRISLININACKIIGLNAESAKGKTLCAILGEQNEPFLHLAKSDVPVMDVEVRIFSKKSSNDYTLTSNPIYSQAGEIIGKVLILNEINRAKTLVTKMMGAKAKFHFEDICGRNPKFLMTIEQARMVSQNSSNVLLLGESGTGKDIFAQAIHNASSRRQGPYVAINCAAIPRDLITSELFGYSEGAFTGSRRGGNHGKFALADGGTIFLDEIADTPLNLQAVLLRVIEDKSVIRIGGTRVRSVDVRIIAATNKDLREEVRKGNFREDLFYRLHVFTICMVPLRERLDDIPHLVDGFIQKYGNAIGRSITRVDGEVMEAFRRYPWPGNVRELQNVIERMVHFTRTSELKGEHLPAELASSPYPVEDPEDLEVPREVERRIISRMLHLEVPKNKIAQKLGVSRTTLYRKLAKYGLS